MFFLRPRKRQGQNKSQTSKRCFSNTFTFTGVVNPLDSRRESCWFTRPPSAAPEICLPAPAWMNHEACKELFASQEVSVARAQQRGSKRSSAHSRSDPRGFSNERWKSIAIVLSGVIVWKLGKIQERVWGFRRCSFKREENVPLGVETNSSYGGDEIL